MATSKRAADPRWRSTRSIEGRAPSRLEHSLEHLIGGRAHRAPVEAVEVALLEVYAWRERGGVERVDRRYDRVFVGGLLLALRTRELKATIVGEAQLDDAFVAVRGDPEWRVLRAVEA